MDNATGTALVLEGGGFRGVYTAGVLDVLMEKGVYGFSSVWGVSAGSMAATNFKSRQIGRTVRVMLTFRDDPRFMSLQSFVKTGNLAGGEFLYEEVQNHLDPCDSRTFNDNPLPMYAVASDVVFGTPAYLPVRHFPEDVRCIQASASLPAVSRIVEIDGHRYLDGGTCDAIPYAAAMGLPEAREVEGYAPARRALVVLTQDRDYVKHWGGSQERLAVHSHRYDDYPFFIEALRSRAERYNACRQRLWDLEEKGDCLVIAPTKPVEVKVNAHDGAPLLDLYLQGRAQATERLDEIREFLER